jgi:Flp pilus assembly protein protease CpaA
MTNVELLSVLPLGVVFIAVLIAAGTDLWSFRIPNALTIPLFLSGLLYQTCSGGPSGLVLSVLGVMIANVPFIPIYTMGAMGAGDIKLLAGVGAWLGPWVMLHVVIVSGLATGCYSAGLFVWNRLRSESPPVTERSDQPDVIKEADDVIVVLSRPDRRWNAVPFGVMVAFSVIVTGLWVR